MAQLLFGAFGIALVAFCLGYEWGWKQAHKLAHYVILRRRDH